MRGIILLLAFSIGTLWGPCESFMTSESESSGGSSSSQDATPVDSAELQSVADFIVALENEGASVEEVDTISQPFFAVDGEVLIVNETAEMQVYAYGDMDTALQEASLVSPDGSSIGTSMVSWIMPPHFYQSGNLIVIYLGTDADTLALLEGILGPQFAGQ